jgi:hypothetical protein
MEAPYPEEDICKAISSPVLKLGYRELRPNQELAVKHFLRAYHFLCAVERVVAIVSFVMHLTFFKRLLKHLSALW